MVLLTFQHIFRYYRCLSFLIRYKFREGQFEKFLEAFSKGEISFGDYYDHLNGYLPHLHDRNFLLLIYEKMATDPIQQIIRIASKNN